MNLILFRDDELERPLSPEDPRALHIIKTLRRKEGENFDVGLLNGKRGKAFIASRSNAGLHLVFSWIGDPPPPLDNIVLLLGLPRPQTARRILRDACSLGVQAMYFAQTEKSEPSYAQSSLWSSGEWKRHLTAGAEQAFDTQLPKISFGENLVTLFPKFPPGSIRIALDNYESPFSLGNPFFKDKGSPCILAFGPERGWGAEDRKLLRTEGFSFAHLGKRVLRMETAVVAALALAKSLRGTWEL